MNSAWKKLQMPAGRHLVCDERYGYLKVMPRPSDKEIGSYYANVYRNPCVPHDPAGPTEIVCTLMSEPGRVLDIGCGEGEFLDSFSKRGWTVVGVEPGHQYAERARARGITVVEEPLTEDLVSQLGTFDAVLLVHVLEHLPHPERMLKMIHQLLKKNGIFYCEVPNDFNPLQEVAVAMHNLPPWWISLPDHLNYFNILTLSDFISGHDFTVLVQTTDFPVEMFLIWGDIYVGNPEAGKAMHTRRCRFEDAMRLSGKGDLLRRLYDKMAELGIGREAIVCARRD